MGDSFSVSEFVLSVIRSLKSQRTKKRRRVTSDEASRRMEQLETRILLSVANGSGTTREDALIPHGYDLPDLSDFEADLIGGETVDLGDLTSLDFSGHLSELDPLSLPHVTTLYGPYSASTIDTFTV